MIRKMGKKNYKNNHEYFVKKATELVEQMTVEEMATQLRYDSPPIQRLGIPRYNWWNEGLHGVARAGVATMFPQAIALAAMFDEELLREIADVIATEARAKYNAQSKLDDRDIYRMSKVIYLMGYNHQIKFELKPPHLLIHYTSLE